MNRVKAGGPPPHDITPPPEFWDKDEAEDFASSFLLIGAISLLALFLLALVGFGAGVIWGWLA